VAAVVPAEGVGHVAAAAQAEEVGQVAVAAPAEGAGQVAAAAQAEEVGQVGAAAPAEGAGRVAAAPVKEAVRVRVARLLPAALPGPRAISRRTSTGGGISTRILREVQEARLRNESVLMERPPLTGDAEPTARRSE